MRKLYLLVLLAFAYVYSNAQCNSGTYTEPQFSISVQNPNCPVAGEIRVTSVTGGVGPYTYTLTPGNIVNSTGVFSNVSPGTYFVEMKDACGTIRTRQATITPYAFSTSSSYTSLGCGQFEFAINCSATGPALQYGYSFFGDTTINWGTSAVFSLYVGRPTNVSLYVKDSCGNIAVSQQSIPQHLIGYIKELQERIECSWQEIYPVYFGFNEPKVCLYKSPQNELVECKQAPPGGYTGGSETNFFNLPFGQDWYVIVEDGCFRDSMFFKDKTSAGGVEMNPFNWKCNTFDLHADGNNSGIVCLYNSLNDSLISCKQANDTAINPNTGLPWPYGGAEWYDLPYGTYYAYIFDPCADSLIRIDTTVVYPHKRELSLWSSCMVTETLLYSNFSMETPLPWTTRIFWPNDSLVKTNITTCTCNPMNFFTFPTSPSPSTYKIIQEDGCGRRDTGYLVQPPMYPVRRFELRGGCPGINGLSGGGDIIMYGNRTAYQGPGIGAPISTAKIIRKDGAVVDIPSAHSYFNGSERVYEFTNLTVGIYVIESSVGCEGYKVLDTFDVKPYVYPTQGQTHILQCGINSFAFRDTVVGGLAPFTYEITATSPLVPSFLTGVQSSNVFIIPPGNNLNTITIQVKDACGNSNTKEFPVQHSYSCETLEVNNSDSRPQFRSSLVKIYPNPASKDFTIAFAQRKKTDYQVEIFNSAGIKLFNQVLRNVDFKEFQVNESFKSGAYIVTITDLKNSQRQHFKQIIF